MRSLAPRIFTSLKTRVTVLMLLLFLGSIWLFTYLIASHLESKFTEVLADQQFASASYTASEVEQKVRLRFNMLEQVAGEITPAMMQSPTRLRALLANRPVLLSRFEGGVVAIAANGKGVADLPQLPGRATGDFTEQAYFRDVIASGRPTLGKPQVGRFSKNLGVVFAVPIRDDQRTIIGTLAALATLSDPAFIGNINEAKVGATGWIAVNDTRHRLIIAINDPKRILQPLPESGVNAMLDRYVAGFEGSGISVNSKGQSVLSSAKKVGNTGWFVQLVLPADEAFAPIRELVTRAYLLAGVLSLVVALVVWTLIQRLLQPLAAATANIHDITEDEGKLRELPVTRHDEVGELLHSFNQLFRQRQCLEDALERQARTDPLTGLPNRRHFFEAVAQEQARMARFGGSATLLMLDIDHFKVINDTHGHASGDAVLRALADACRASLREIDLLARFGGEEFALLLPGTERAAALEIAERLRATLASCAVANATGATLHFTVSIGVASFSDPAADINVILHQADQALYEAKRTGRNRICITN